MQVTCVVCFKLEGSCTGVTPELYSITLVRLLCHQKGEQCDVRIHRWLWLAMTLLQVDLRSYLLILFKLRSVGSYSSSMLFQTVYTFESCDCY